MKNKKKKMKVLLIAPLLIILLSSCITWPTKEKTDLINKIEKPAFPDPIGENGEALLYYDVTLNKYIVEPCYMQSILEYGLSVEAAFQALENIK